MNSKDIIKIDADLAYLFHSLFGDKTYRNIKGKQDFKNYKRYLLKLFQIIKSSTYKNIINTDETHKKEISALINNSEELLKLSDDFNSINQSFISFETELIFLLLGNMPRKLIESRKNKYSLQLDGYRTLFYLQNNEQKRELIFHLVYSEKYKDILPKYSELTNIFKKNCLKNNTEFISWFKKNYPQVYLEIF